MFVAPHVRCQIQGQPFAADSTFGRQPAFQIPPAAFQASDVRPVPTPKLAVVMVDQAMDIAVGGHPGIEPQGIGAADSARVSQEAEMGLYPIIIIPQTFPFVIEGTALTQSDPLSSGSFPFLLQSAFCN